MTAIAYSRHYKKHIGAALLVGMFSLSAGVWLLGLQGAIAATNYSPYATAVIAQSGTSDGTAQNAVGAPDGRYANFLGLNNSVTLDMGQGQEGTGNLQIDLGPVTVQSTVNVSFLDSSQAVIGTASQTLVLNSSSSKLVFAYDWHNSGAAYRFVKIATPVSVGFGIDAVEKLGYIGATPTQDLDGDGIADRQDAEPLVFNKTTPPPNSNPGNGSNGTNGSNGSNAGSGANGSNGGGSGSSSNTTSTTSDGSNNAGTSAGTVVFNNGSSGKPLNARLASFMQHAWSWILFYSLMLNALLAFFVAWVFAGARQPNKNSSQWERLHHRIFQALLPRKAKS